MNILDGYIELSSDDISDVNTNNKTNNKGRKGSDVTKIDMAIEMINPTIPSTSPKRKSSRSSEERKKSLDNKSPTQTNESTNGEEDEESEYLAKLRLIRKISLEKEKLYIEKHSKSLLVPFNNQQIMKFVSYAMLCLNDAAVTGSNISMPLSINCDNKFPCIKTLFDRKTIIREDSILSKNEEFMNKWNQYVLDIFIIFRNKLSEETGIRIRSNHDIKKYKSGIVLAFDDREKFKYYHLAVWW